MTLPNTFKFTRPACTDPSTYTATRNVHGFRVTWDNCGLDYSFFNVEEFIASGKWKIVEPVTSNGVNDKGEPIHFDVSMHKIGQRVKLRNEQWYIVMPNAQQVYFVNYTNNKFCYVTSEGWTVASLDYELNHEYDVVEIYDAPTYNAQLLDSGYVGKLLWKRVNDLVVEENKRKLNQCIKECQEAINDYLELIKEENEVIVSKQKELDKLNG